MASSRPASRSASSISITTSSPASTRITAAPERTAHQNDINGPRAQNEESLLDVPPPIARSGAASVDDDQTTNAVEDPVYARRKSIDYLEVEYKKKYASLVREKRDAVRERDDALHRAQSLQAEVDSLKADKGAFRTHSNDLQRRLDAANLLILDLKDDWHRREQSMLEVGNSLSAAHDVLRRSLSSRSRSPPFSQSRPSPTMPRSVSPPKSQASGIRRPLSPYSSRLGTSSRPPTPPMTQSRINIELSPVSPTIHAVATPLPSFRRALSPLFRGSQSAPRPTSAMSTTPVHSPPVGINRFGTFQENQENVLPVNPSRSTSPSSSRLRPLPSSLPFPPTVTPRPGEKRAFLKAKARRSADNAKKDVPGDILRSIEAGHESISSLGLELGGSSGWNSITMPAQRHPRVKSPGPVQVLREATKMDSARKRLRVPNFSSQTPLSAFPLPPQNASPKHQLIPLHPFLPSSSSSTRVLSPQSSRSAAVFSPSPLATYAPLSDVPRTISPYRDTISSAAKRAAALDHDHGPAPVKKKANVQRSAKRGSNNDSEIGASTQDGNRTDETVERLARYTAFYENVKDVLDEKELRFFRSVIHAFSDELIPLAGSSGVVTQGSGILERALERRGMASEGISLVQEFQRAVQEDSGALSLMPLVGMD